MNGKNKYQWLLVLGFVLGLTSYHQASAAGFYVYDISMPDSCKKLGEDFVNYEVDLNQQIYYRATKGKNIYYENIHLPGQKEYCGAAKLEKQGLSGRTRIDFYRGFSGKIYAQVQLEGYHVRNNLTTNRGCLVTVDFEVDPRTCKFGKQRVLEFNLIGLFPIF